MGLAGVIHPAQPQCFVTVLKRMQAWEHLTCLFLSNKANQDVLVPSFTMWRIAAIVAKLSVFDVENTNLSSKNPMAQK